MQLSKSWLLPALLSMMILITSCTSGGSPAEMPDTPAKVEDQQPSAPAAALIEKGEVILKDGPKWLITKYNNQSGTPRIDAYWMSINATTELQNNQGQPLVSGDIPVGAQVDAYHTGQVAESYPAQTGAAKIIMHTEQQAGSSAKMGRAAAISAALSSDKEPSAGRAVKAASLDQAAGVWTVEIVRYEAIEKPVIVKINASTGDLIPVPVAENDVFRVFSPQPETEIGSPIIVKGQARVFEAAFSWTLEDGHNILAQGHEMASAGAPEWGDFQFEINYDKASQPHMMLILFVHSAKDGSIINELVIPLKAPMERIQYKGDSK
jgi:hypothetical protein